MNLWSRLHLLDGVPPALYDNRKGARSSPADGGSKSRTLGWSDIVSDLHDDFYKIVKALDGRISDKEFNVNAPLPEPSQLKFPAVDSRSMFEFLCLYLKQPGKVIASNPEIDHYIYVHDEDSSRLKDGYASKNYALEYNNLVLKILGNFFSPLDAVHSEGPRTLRDVLGVLCDYMLADANEYGTTGHRWSADLKVDGVTPYRYLTGPVANRILGGVVSDADESNWSLRQARDPDTNNTVWSLETAYELLSLVVDALGEDFVPRYANDFLGRCDLALAGTAPRGAFEGVDGRLLVAVIGLSRFRGLNPSDPAGFPKIFRGFEYPEDLPRRLNAWIWLWTGSKDSERPVVRRLAEKVLHGAGWMRDWEGKAEDDHLFETLRDNPDAFPRDLGRSMAIPASTSIGGSTSPSEPGACDFQLLDTNEVYAFRPITIAVLGMSGVGKTSLVNAVLHHLLDDRAELFEGADAFVLADRGSRAIRDGIAAWREGGDTPGTSETVLDYDFEIPRLMTVRLIDHGGRFLDLGGEAEGGSGEAGAAELPSEGESEEAEDSSGSEPSTTGEGRQARENGQAEADGVLANTMAQADGVILVLSAESLIQEARKGRVAPDRRTPELDAIAVRLGHILRSRCSDHVPVALTVSKLDQIIEDTEDYKAMYKLGAVFGDGVSGGHLPRVRAKELLAWSVRRPITTLSLAVQSTITRTVNALGPVLAQIAAYTRRVELFFTSSKPFVLESGAMSSGPAAIISWMLRDNLVPAFLAQAKVQIERDREAVSLAKKDLEIVRMNVRSIAIDPRAGAVISVLPGWNKLYNKLRTKRIKALKQVLGRYNEEKEIEDDPSNDKLFAARDRFKARIDHATREIDAMETRLEAFEVWFRSIRSAKHDGNGKTSRLLPPEAPPHRAARVVARGEGDARP